MNAKALSVSKECPSLGEAHLELEAGLRIASLVFAFCYFLPGKAHEVECVMNGDHVLRSVSLIR